VDPHYGAVKSLTAQGEPEQDRIEKKLDKRLFWRRFGSWFYGLIISLLPFILIFFLHTGPSKNFKIIEFFDDNALFYVCVTLSALALYTYKTKKWVRGLHTFLLATGIVIYYVFATGSPIPLFQYEYGDKKVFIAAFLAISIVMGVITLLNSSIKRGKKL
jgi:hypothetical protein